ncbi:MAG TPA: antibiotic biosynthesis monooxygenase family protein [Candidatus Saccharimonadales bacterium]|jgi:quinol monooxygenase YgiN|nr:antibiotic biosynthesis monooxygenase family protein [Candidatus Saccharimonadales bacterium]
MTEPMIRQLATYQVRPAAVDRVLSAIREFVAYVQASEPDTLRYEAWQEKGDPTRFTHVFVFRDADAEEKHSQSEAVKTFSGILYPECLAPVRFVDFELVATNQPPGRV